MPKTLWIGWQGYQPVDRPEHPSTYLDNTSLNLKYFCIVEFKRVVWQEHCRFFIVILLKDLLFEIS
jgi:hypothetical protein